MNRFAEFLKQHFREEPGSAVKLVNVTRQFYRESDPLASFDFPPDRIRGFLESRFPVATVNHQVCVGNLAGPDSFLVSDRPLVIAFNQLMPRDLKPDEYPRARSDHSRPTVHTLSPNEMRARGWDQIIFSRAERMASLRTIDSEW